MTVTQKDVAEAAGVSVMTVSRVLRGLPVVRSGVAARVKAAAAKLGYKPDPLVQTLMVQRASRRSASGGVTLAWMGDGGPRWLAEMPPGEGLLLARYFEGARRAAADEGFRLEEFQPGDFGKRLSGAVLAARGVPGILLGPVDGAQSLPVHNPEAFAFLQIGLTRHNPAIDRVAADSYLAMQICLEKLQEAGFRRIGYFDGFGHNLRNERRWEAAHAVFQKSGSPLPPRLVQDGAAFSTAALRAMIRDQRLDAVVSGREIVWHWLRASRTTRRIGFACPNLDEPAGPVPGVASDFRSIGAAATRNLIAAVQRGRRGLQDHPQTINLVGQWWPGEG